MKHSFTEAVASSLEKRRIATLRGSSPTWRRTLDGPIHQQKRYAAVASTRKWFIGKLILFCFELPEAHDVSLRNLQPIQ